MAEAKTNSGLQTLGTVLATAMLVATIMYSQSSAQDKANADLLARIVELEKHDLVKDHQNLVGHPGVLSLISQFEVKFIEVETKFQGEKSARVAAIERLDEVMALQHGEHDRRILKAEDRIDVLPVVTGRLVERVNRLERESPGPGCREDDRVMQ